MGLAFDAHGRLYVSSDASGEIFRIRYTSGSNSAGVASKASRIAAGRTLWITLMFLGGGLLF